MTRIGWIGLGKLGLPCALALAARGKHEVAGYDMSDVPRRILHGLQPPPREAGLGELLNSDHGMTIETSPAAVVALSDVVIAAVQTPHAPGYGGETPAPARKRDFEYAFLVQAARDVCAAAQAQCKPVTLAVLSTVLPGTMNRLIRPLANDYVRLLYSPSFISLGTVIRDFSAPELVLCGTDCPDDAEVLREAYRALHDAPFVVCDFQTAEMAKMMANMFQTMKITFAGMIMEMCHKTGADCDVVTSALSLGVIGGMCDGGPCRPRDLIALSWLAERLGLSYDLAAATGQAREAAARWLAELARSYADQAGLQLVILGGAYKPGTDLTAGSPALLLAHYAGAGIEAVVHAREGPAVFVIATRHEEYRARAFPRGSVVVDPWGYIPDQPGVTVIRTGRR